MQQLINNLNKIATEKMKTGVKEYVTYEQAEDALSIVKMLRIKTQYDVLLFCAAMNLLNTYVKQSDRRFGYFFKSYFNHLFIALTRNDIKGITVSFDIEISKKNQENAYVIVQIQFSFHQVKVTAESIELERNTNIVRKLEFDGIKK